MLSKYLNAEIFAESFQEQRQINQYLIKLFNY